jgi:hypothetical protein
MSKELTEQWRNGTLPYGKHYYIKTIFSDNVYIVKCIFDGLANESILECGKDTTEEILAPVPSFPDICELKQELEICKEGKADLYAKLCNALMQLESRNNQLVELTEKVERLEKKLEIATKVFKDITLAINMPSRVYMFSRSQQALKEMEGVK